MDQLKARAKGYGVSITEYLTAVLLKVIVDKQHRERPRREKPVALAIPINLRAWFPSETLRNFILTVRPCIDPSLGEYTFAEVVSQVHHFLRLNINRQQMQALLTGNVKFTTNRLLQIVPIVLKNPVMALGYRLSGVRPYSGTYTNPGPFPVRRRWPPTSAAWRLFWGRPPIRGSTAPPSATAIPWRSRSPGPFRRPTPSGISSASWCREGIPVKVESNRTVRSELMF